MGAIAYLSPDLVEIVAEDALEEFGGKCPVCGEAHRGRIVGREFRRGRRGALVESVMARCPETGRWFSLRRSSDGDDYSRAIDATMRETVASPSRPQWYGGKWRSQGAHPRPLRDPGSGTRSGPVTVRPLTPEDVARIDAALAAKEPRPV